MTIKPTSPSVSDLGPYETHPSLKSYEPRLLPDPRETMLRVLGDLKHRDSHEADWFARNADVRNSKAMIHTDSKYFAAECATAIAKGTLVYHFPDEPTRTMCEAAVATGFVADENAAWSVWHAMNDARAALSADRSDPAGEGRA